jgi:hypothetical protein
VTSLDRPVRRLDLEHCRAAVDIVPDLYVCIELVKLEGKCY